jgi:DNA-directed RNA polymerase specialized sigma24 family protein
MTADYNGWTDAPEAEREAMDVYSRQELEREALAQQEELQKVARRLTGSRDGAEDLVSWVAEEITRAIDALPQTYRATYGDLRPAA